MHRRVLLTVLAAFLNPDARLPRRFRANMLREIEREGTPGVQVSFVARVSSVANFFAHRDRG